MFDIEKLSNDILKLKNQKDFEVYIESNFIEIENYLLNISNEEINDIRFDIEDVLDGMIEQKFILNQNSKTINAFLILLAEKFLQTSLIGSITIINNYLPNGATKLRLDAAKLYLKVNDISKDYTNKTAKILELLELSSQSDEYNTKAIKSFFFFIKSALQQFLRVKNETFAKDLINNIVQQKVQFKFLQDEFLVEFFEKIRDFNVLQSLNLVSQYLEQISYKKTVCSIDNFKISMESSSYTKSLQNLVNPTFEAIRNISYKYIQSIGDPEELYNRLQRGENIIDDENLLYKYLVSFGGKHKLKLDSAYELIIDKLKDQKFDIVDWGCGQATATMVLLDYAKKKNINLNIENITLIEPSFLSLSRGILHINTLKQKEYNIKAINSDLDCLDSREIIKSQNKKLHLFSNILDIESFSIDNSFFKKASDTLENDAIFICVSPNRNDKLNNRLDLFYNYFNENFNTELISARENDIGNASRYEKIFEVKYIKETIIEEKRNDIKLIEKNYQIDFLQELDKYSSYIVPILDMKLLEKNIDIDPEYAIFKIRKVAEVITGKIYSKYEDNEQIISFNDMIRYLAYEQKVFTKTITNYVQTLRTIGNRGVHGNEMDISKLKLDAHLMVIALISFIKEIKDNKLI